MLKKIAIFIMGISVLLVPNFAPVNAVKLDVSAAKNGFWVNKQMVAWFKGIAGVDKEWDNNDELMTVIQKAINWGLGSLWLITFVLLLWAGFQMVTAAGDYKKFGEGFKILKNAGIGLLFIAVSWLLVSMLFWVIDNVTKEEKSNPTISPKVTEIINPSEVL